tara:strand:+ start:477 stop:632 length:156 start_codon:yes stop_codon:yes gene_type:complete
MRVVIITIRYFKILPSTKSSALLTSLVFIIKRKKLTDYLILKVNPAGGLVA